MPTLVGRGKPGPTVEAGPSLAAEGGRFFVGPGSSRPAEPGLGAVWCPTLVGQGKPGPTQVPPPRVRDAASRTRAGSVVQFRPTLEQGVQLLLPALQARQGRAGFLGRTLVEGRLGGFPPP